MKRPRRGGGFQNPHLDPRGRAGGSAPPGCPHRSHQRGYGGYQASCPLSYSLSLFSVPQLLKGHVRCPNVPSRVPVPCPRDTLGTKMSHPLSHVPVPCSQTYPRDTLGYQNVPPHVPHPSSLSPSCPRHPVHQPVTTACQPHHLPSSIKAPLFCPDKARAVQPAPPSPSLSVFLPGLSRGCLCWPHLHPEALLCP